MKTKKIKKYSFHILYGYFFSKSHVICAMFLFIIFKLFWNVSSIPDLPVVLVFPIVALITVPTIILVIVLLCLYREKTKIGVDTVVKVAESAISASK